MLKKHGRTIPFESWHPLFPLLPPTFFSCLPRRRRAHVALGSTSSARCKRTAGCSSNSQCGWYVVGPILMTDLILLKKKITAQHGIGMSRMSPTAMEQRIINRNNKLMLWGFGSLAVAYLGNILLLYYRFYLLFLTFSSLLTSVLAYDYIFYGPWGRRDAADYAQAHKYDHERYMQFQVHCCSACNDRLFFCFYQGLKKKFRRITPG